MSWWFFLHHGSLLTDSAHSIQGGGEEMILLVMMELGCSPLSLSLIAELTLLFLLLIEQVMLTECRISRTYLVVAHVVLRFVLGYQSLVDEAHKIQAFWNESKSLFEAQNPYHDLQDLTMSPHMPGPGCHKNIGLTQMGIDCLYTFLTSLSHDIWFIIIIIIIRYGVTSDLILLSLSKFPGSMAGLT
ncbi:hypothetical protein NC653_018716 [Populus alba x Populus x berolinensis]|uniref:Uncharacterized protein n=1 Tax=Populus alba x Populus x berolinensis TaxID=444605 RepID=A0AAD6QH04_9ROSI|nr:hypothetical protein NC653_018716 [Populus alba x Populus x berolinensis]